MVTIISGQPLHSWPLARTTNPLTSVSSSSGRSTETCEKIPSARPSLAVESPMLPTSGPRPGIRSASKLWIGPRSTPSRMTGSGSRGLHAAGYPSSHGTEDRQQQ